MNCSIAVFPERHLLYISPFPHIIPIKLMSELGSPAPSVPHAAIGHHQFPIGLSLYSGHFILPSSAKLHTRPCPIKSRIGKLPQSNLNILSPSACDDLSDQARTGEKVMDNSQDLTGQGLSPIREAQAHQSRARPRRKRGRIAKACSQCHSRKQKVCITRRVAFSDP